MPTRPSTSQLPNPIETLPPPTQSKLRSTQILTSLPQIISELVQNSLDAQARQIDVGVDCEEWECWVRDDGVGMNKDGLARLVSGLKEGRYNTSKAYTPASLEEVTTFGFRGEALASAADVSCLEISSRTARSRESWSIILKGGSNLYNGPSIRWRRETHGTTVSVRDAFYNLPIRRRSHPPPQKTIETIRREIETYALVFPHVSFTLEETKRAKSGSSERTPHRVLSIPKTKSIVSTFRHLYGRALAEHVDEIDESRDDLRIEGFISLEGAQSKSHQFLYLNRHPLAVCDLHRIIDLRFGASTFSKHAFDEYGQMSQPRSTIRRSPRKCEKKPVYVLNLTIPPRHIDNCLEPAKASVHLRDAESVSALVSSVVQAFLVRHGFASDRPKPREREEGTPSPRKKRRLDRQDEDGPSSRQRPQTETAIFTSTSQDGGNVVWMDPSTGIRYVVDKRTGNSYPVQLHQEDGGGTTSARGEESGLGQRKPTLRRTIGSSKIDDDTPQWIRKALQANQAYTLSERKIPSVVPFPSTSTSTSNATPSTRTRSRNDSCRVSWHDVTALPWDESTSGSGTGMGGGRLRKEDLGRVRVVGQVDRKFVACVLEGNGEVYEGEERLKGTTLILIDQHAADERVRVERFLKELCSAFLQYASPPPPSPPPDDAVAELDRAVPVLLAKHEAVRIVQSEETRRVFERWGVRFGGLDGVVLGGEQEGSEEELDVLRLWRPKSKRGKGKEQEKGKGKESAGEGAGTGESGYTQVMVKSVPALLRDKLLMDGELRDLIKSTLAHIDTVGYPSTHLTTPAPSQLPTPSCSQQHPLHPPFPSSQSTSHPVWQRALRHCPPHLLDLVNSKACRGAIMFNDPLTLEQCERLVGQLARTDAPFQCAHGRPSLVPLVRVCGEAWAQGQANGSGEDVKPANSKRMREVDWEGFGSAASDGGP
ncbi:DNA mismatch repair protein [Steccherinum ochraceum]|uniref:DNA mismatch repair protein n=1 Tax=Steccherinum ochraceum TaxID=92696 RepID=A0A4V2MX89_9APHY|nr:DNA mismatch repair protein [Steccherinum ochraceum]